MNPKTIKATVETKAELVSCEDLIIGGIPYSIDLASARLQNYQADPTGGTIITGKVLADSLEISSLTPSSVNAQYTKTSQITPATTSTVAFSGNLATTTVPNSSAVPTTTCTTTCDVTNNTDTTTKNPPLVGLFASNLLSGNAILQLGRDLSTSSTLSYNISTTNYMAIGNRIEIYPTYVNITGATNYIGGTSAATALKAPTFISSSGTTSTVSNSAVPQTGVQIPANTREIVVTFKNLQSTACFLGVQFSVNSTFATMNINLFEMVGNGYTDYETNVGVAPTNKWLYVDKPNWGFPIYFPALNLASRKTISGRMKFDYIGIDASNQQMWNVSLLASADASNDYWNFVGSMKSSANLPATYIRLCIYNPYSGNTDTVFGQYQITFF